MKIFIRIIVIVTIFLIGVDSVYAGGGTRNGTGGATELVIPVGASGIALGGSNLSTASGLDALFWNPAGVANMTNSATAMFSHMDYIANIGVEYGAVAANFEGFGVISLDIKSLSIGSIPVTTNDQPDGTGQTFTPQFLTAGATFSRALTDRIAIGLTVNYISETIAQVSATGFGVNAGVQYKDLGDISGLSFGLVIKNIGPQMTYGGPGLLVQASPTGSTSTPTDPFNRAPSFYSINAAAFDLPSSFDIGFGYKPTLDDMNSLQISGVFENNNFSGDLYNVGVEYGYNKMFFARVGYSMSPKNQDPNYIYGFSAGAGINYDLGGMDIRLDYAYRSAKYLNGNSVFEVSLGF
ncbi:MAG TPA: PorV/PorQ family protein [Ignavibacteriaceae bacterium]|nr:PorV/PorQ family protein [Ignavibacteriaceae bacterium]